jgi:hypothetical protein
VTDLVSVTLLRGEEGLQQHANAEGQADAALGFVTRQAGCYMLRDFVFEV